MRLQPTGLSALHVLANAIDAAGIHRVSSKSVFFDQIAKVRLVKGVGDDLIQLGANFRLLTVTDRSYQQLTQSLALQLHLAEDIKDLASESFAGFIELFQQRVINIAFAGLRGD